MSLHAPTRGAEVGADYSVLGAGENPASHGLQASTPTQQHPVQIPSAGSLDRDIRDQMGCELAAEVLRSSGKLRLRATGASMLPVVWPGDILNISGEGAGKALPGDIVLFGREGGLIAHRVVEIRNTKSEVRSPRSEVGIQDLKFEIQYSESLAADSRQLTANSGQENSLPKPIENRKSKIQNLESRVEFVTRGDSVEGNDAPVSSHEILGRVIAIQRGSRQIIPHQSVFTRIASWVLSRSDFATGVVLKARFWVLGAGDKGFKI